MADGCNSRHFSRLMKSCFPDQKNYHQPIFSATTSAASTVSSLPDDLLLECLSRVPSSSLPSLSLVCRRWSHLLRSPSFPLLRRQNGQLRLSLFAFSLSNFSGSLLSAILPSLSHTSWNLSSISLCESISLECVRALSINHTIYIFGRNSNLQLDTWTGKFTTRSPMIFSRKKFASAVISGKIYASGGTARAPAVEEYDPEIDTWCVVADAPRRRYGCFGASIDGVFYVIGGLKVGAAVGAEARMYAASMDLYDVEARAWLRSRVVPGGGCIVAACASNGRLYVLASHAVELSFWQFDARRKNVRSNNGGGFGGWCRIRGPPLPAQCRVDGSVKFSCVAVGVKVVLIQVNGCIDDLLRRSGRSERGFREGLVLVYDSVAGEWSRGPDLPEVFRRAVVACVEC